MDSMSRAAYIIAMAACAQIEAQGMVAENQRRDAECMPPFYVQEDFDQLINKYGIHHNAVLQYLGT